MRMRKMKNLDVRMERCAALRIAEPAALKGNWRSLKPDATALWVEVGCGKGKFTAETAAANPDVLMIAVERCREAMVVAMEKAQSMKLTNVFYIDMDVANIEEIFAGEEIDRLFINFPDPWPRKKNAKRRLTHRGLLDKYCRVVRTGGEIHYKTDNAPLFEFSVEEFAACGLQVNNLTRNLHENGIVGIMTGYEEKFHGLGTPINRCEVVCKPFVLPPEEKKHEAEETEESAISVEEDYEQESNEVQSSEQMIEESESLEAEKSETELGRWSEIVPFTINTVPADSMDSTFLDQSLTTFELFEDEFDMTPLAINEKSHISDVTDVAFYMEFNKAIKLPEDYKTNEDGYVSLGIVTGFRKGLK
mgnify:CR=1 FL=1